jgi:NAD(P)-dependent dehydrogenase (short-subunit alcohol dehydrogenase family)
MAQGSLDRKVSLMAQTVLVTGVGKETGIGFALCSILAARGDRVWLTARTMAQAEALAPRIGGEIRPAACDIADPAQVSGLAAEIAAEGGLDVLINNAAGVAPWGETAAGADLGIACAVMDATLFGTWAMCQAFLPLLRQSASGRIVNVSSGAGSHGDAAFGLTTGNGMGTSYAVAKAALNALTVKLALEETTPTLRINAVCPGFTATFKGGAGMGARPVADGAASVLWAADIANDGPTGGFFRDGMPLPW